VRNEDVDGWLWRGTAADPVSPTCLEAGEDGVSTPMKQTCSDELPRRRMPGRHENDAGRETLPGAAVPAPVVDGRLSGTPSATSACAVTTPSVAAPRRCSR